MLGRTGWQVREHCAAALYAIGSSFRFRGPELLGSLLPALSALSGSDSVSARRHCAALLSRLAAEPENRAELIGRGVQLALVRLARQDDNVVLSYALSALVHISREPLPPGPGAPAAAKPAAAGPEGSAGGGGGGGSDVSDAVGLVARLSGALVRFSSATTECLRAGCAAALCNFSAKVSAARPSVCLSVCRCATSARR